MKLLPSRKRLFALAGGLVHIAVFFGIVALLWAALGSQFRPAWAKLFSSVAMTSNEEMNLFFLAVVALAILWQSLSISAGIAAWVFRYKNDASSAAEARKIP
ncbi:MAG: hypothetical protein AB1704_20505 [Pseudomonadota bacterium]